MPIVELSIDSSGALVGAKTYDQATDQIVKSTKKTEGAFSKMRAGINNLGPAVKIGLAAGATALAAFSVKAVNLASDLEETQNKFDVVFKGMTETAEAWATDLQENYLMTTEESKRFLASTQDLLKPMGVAADKAGEMSVETAKLAADLGSFNNLETADVMDKIQSALVGNYESVKSLGIVLSKTKVEANAYATGLVKVGEEADTAALAQSALDLIMQGSKDAQGDLARSAGSYALQMKQLRTNITELVTDIGALLLPVITQIVTAVNLWLVEQGGLNTLLNGAITIIQGLYNAYQGIILVLKGVVVAIAKFAEFTIKAFRAVMKPTDLLFKAIEKLGGPKNPFDKLEGVMEDFSASAVENFNKTWTSVKSFDETMQELKGTVNETVPAVDELSGSLSQTTIAGNEADDMLGVVADTVKDVETNTNAATQAIVKLGDVAINVPKQMEEAYNNLNNQLEYSALVTEDWGGKTEIAVEWAEKGKTAVDGLSAAQMKSMESAKSATTATQQYAGAVQQLGNAAAQSAGHLGQMAAAGGAAASVSGGANPPAGSGAAGGGGKKTQSRGSASLPEWFTDEMVKAWNRDYIDKYLHNQDYIFNPLIKGRAQGELNILKNFDLWARANFGVSNPNNSNDPSQDIGADPVGNGRVGSGGGGVTVNVNQNMGASEIAALISEIERSEARG